MMGPFLQGAGYVLKGLGLLTHPRLRSFVLIPLLINMLLFGGAIWWGSGEFVALLDWLAAKTQGWLQGWPAWLEWLATALGWLVTGLTWLLWPLFVLTALIVTFYTFTLVANLIASPFNSILAERVEDLVQPGRTRPAGRPLWQEVAYAPFAELRKLGYFLVRALPLLVLFLIPVLNLAAPFLWMAFGAWMLALQYADYPMGNHGLVFRDQRAVLSRRRRLTLGFGAGVLAMTLVPVLNFLAMPTAVIGATLLWVEQFPQGAGTARLGRG